jgi:prepilin-type N-terminal cleavage/methylation domain-containing protein
MKNKSERLSRKAGFSLLETIMVIALLGIILSLGMVVSLYSFKSTIFRSERATALSILEKARNRSMNNYLKSRHGVCLDNSTPSKPQYVLFQGSYSPSAITNEYLESSPAVTFVSIGNTFFCSSGPGIIFERLSGNTASSTVTLIEDNRVSVISVNEKGRINW